MTADDLNIAIEIRALRKALDEVVVEMLESSPPKWEYHKTPFNPTMNYIAHFNKKVANGWELIRCDFDKEIAVFKRPK